MNYTDKIFDNNNNIESFSRGYIKHLIDTLSLISTKQMEVVQQQPAILLMTLALGLS